MFVLGPRLNRSSLRFRLHRDGRTAIFSSRMLMLRVIISASCCSGRVLRLHFVLQVELRRLSCGMTGVTERSCFPTVFVEEEEDAAKNCQHRKDPGCPRLVQLGPSA